jgi:hypothetical protein
VPVRDDRLGHRDDEADDAARGHKREVPHRRTEPSPDARLT